MMKVKNDPYKSINNIPSPCELYDACLMNDIALLRDVSPCIIGQIHEAWDGTGGDLSA